VAATVVASPLAGYLARSHDRHRRADDGAVATYIPELGRADPAWFGVAAVTLDGRVHQVGDTGVPFTIQSISKPLTYGLVLDDLGEDAVRARIGVEPTGEAFNSITLAAGSGMPLNPMVNAGAIAAAGLVRTPDRRTPLEHLLAGTSASRGDPLPSTTPSLRRSGLQATAIVPSASSCAHRGPSTAMPTRSWSATSPSAPWPSARWISRSSRRRSRMVA